MSLGAGAAVACTTRRRTRSDRVPSPALRPSYKERSRRICIRGPALLPRSSRPPASRPHPMVRPNRRECGRETPPHCPSQSHAVRCARRCGARRCGPQQRRHQTRRRSAGCVCTGRAPLPLAGCGEDPTDRSTSVPRLFRATARGALSRAQEAEAVAVDDGGGQQVRDGGLVDPDLRRPHSRRPGAVQSRPPKSDDPWYRSARGRFRTRVLEY